MAWKNATRHPASQVTPNPASATFRLEGQPEGEVERGGEDERPGGVRGRLVGDQDDQRELRQPDGDRNRQRQPDPPAVEREQPGGERDQPRRVRQRAHAGLEPDLVGGVPVEQEQRCAEDRDRLGGRLEPRLTSRTGVGEGQRGEPEQDRRPPADPDRPPAHDREHEGGHDEQQPTEPEQQVPDRGRRHLPLGGTAAWPERALRPGPACLARARPWSGPGLTCSPASSGRPPGRSPTPGLPRPGRRRADALRRRGAR